MAFFLSKQLTVEVQWRLTLHQCAPWSPAQDPTEGHRSIPTESHHQALRYGSNQLAAALYSVLTRESRGLIFARASSAESFASLEMGSVCLPRCCISSQVCSTWTTPIEADEPLRKCPNEESSIRSLLTLSRVPVRLDGLHHSSQRTHKASSIFLKVAWACVKYSSTMLDEKPWSSSSSSNIWPNATMLIMG